MCLTSFAYQVKSSRLVISFVEARLLTEQNEKIAEIGDFNDKQLSVSRVLSSSAETLDG